MYKEDIPLYKLDLEGNSPYNKVDREYFHRLGAKNNSILIPQAAPFFQKSLKVYDKAGKPLVEGEDYELYGIMGKLTQFTAKPVGLFVRLLKDEIIEGYFEYQVVGNFNKITNEILNMLHSIYEDDRFVMWENIENKPLWFVPEIHQHDLAYQIYGFTDFVRELHRVATLQAAKGSVTEFMIESLQNNLDVYIAGYKDVLMKILTSHTHNLNDAHGTDKSQIGLKLVDNYATATLEETLEGLREDLNITPYNAAQVVEAATGRNERSLPAGSLPLLRYGSDTFIPPTIAGSFEGLGGLSCRCGAIIETDGTLLLLQARSNGKVRGIYFIRCINWQSTTPIYDFTSYRYLHPTATAAGANLDTVINGSNRYIMVVGDSVKNIWYWCETHGTFNPDRHILHRLSGDWVNIDMAMEDPRAPLQPKNKAVVLADKNYKEYFCIFQTYTLEQFRRFRTNYLPDFNTPNLWWLNNGGYSFNIVPNMESTIRRTNVNYTHPIFGNTYRDKFFTPYVPELVTINGVLRLKSFDAIYNPPAARAQNRTVHGYWLNNGSPNEFAFSTQCYVDRHSSDGEGWSNHLEFRATLKISRVGNNYTIDVIPGVGSDKLYTIGPSLADIGKLEYTQYMDNAAFPMVPDDTDTVGSSLVAPGVIAYLNGQANSTFPSTYQIANMEFVTSPAKMIVPRSPGTTGGYNQYSGRGITVVDLNPVGLGTLFQNQVFLAGDTDDYTKSGMMARQNDLTGSYWVFRTMRFLDSNWNHIGTPEQGMYSGKVYQNYPYIPSCSKTNIKNQLVLNNSLPMPGASNNKDRHRYIFGSASGSVLMGDSPADTGTFIPDGDGKWIKEATTKLEDNVLKFTPVTVINMKAAVARDLAPMFSGIGMTAAEVIDTWTHSYVFNSDGSGYSVFLVVFNRVPNVITAAIVTRITPTGTPDTSKGYTEYPDCTITKVSEVKSYTRDYGVENAGIQHPKYNLTRWGYETLPTCVSIPFRSRTSGGVIDTSAFMVSMSTMCRFLIPGGWIPAPAIMEISKDGTQILNIGYHDTQNWGGSQSMSPVPYWGMGNARAGFSLFEGAAIACDIYDQTNSIYNSVVSSTYANTPVIGFSNILSPQYTVYFQKIENVLLAGKMYNIDATYIDILDQDPNPANKIFWVYLIYSGGNATYVISSTVRPETSTQSLIAKVIAGPTQIDSIIPYNRFTIDGVGVSANRQGSTILASSGSLYDIGNTSGILLDSDFIP